MTTILSHPLFGVAILAAIVAAAAWLRRRRYSHRLLSLSTWLLWTGWLCSGPATVWAPAIGGWIDPDFVSGAPSVDGFMACLVFTAPVALLLAELRTRGLDEQTPNLPQMACVLQSFELHCGCIVAALLHNTVWVEEAGISSGWLLPLLATAAAWHAVEQASFYLWHRLGMRRTAILSECALRHHIERLATQFDLTGLEVWRIAGDDQEPGAFSNAQAVAITDTLVTRLTRRELDVVLLHELGHAVQNSAARSHHRYLLRVLWFSAPLLVVLPPHYWAPIFLVCWLGLLLILWRLRAEERQADDHALTHSNDPAAFVTGMVRLHPKLFRQHHGQIRHGPFWADWFSTHPSTFARMAHAARRGGLSQDQVADLVAGAATTAAPRDEQFELPALEPGV